MKKITLIIIACALLGSCKKNILDITPTDRISEDAVWSDPTLPQLFINAQYNALQDGFTNDIQYFGDDCYSQYDLAGYQIVAKGALTSSTVGSISAYYDYWNTGYSAIRNFNIFFQKIGGVPVTPAVRAQMTAEVQFLRAFVYAKLIWNYGGVPIITQAYTINETLTGVKRNTYDECVAYILNDLNAAIAVLPSQQTGANLGRASGDAARALKSRVFIYYACDFNNPTNIAQRWQDASDAEKTIIDSNHYSLSTDFHGLFIGGQNNEVIFAKYYSTDVSQNVGYYSAPVGSGGLDQRDPSQNLVDEFEMTNGVIPVVNGVRNPDPRNTYDATNPYVNRDPRFYASVLYNGATFKGRTIQIYPGGLDFTGNDASPTGYIQYKFIDQTLPISGSTPYTYPWNFFRLAEIYLNYAEAQYELGNEANALLYINKVRERVNMPDITATGTALFNAIVHERRVELAFEGHRYYDTRRWQIAPQTDIVPIQGLSITRNTNGTFNYQRDTLLNRVWNNNMYLIPLALQEVNSSGGSLVQNPGY